MKNPVLPLPLLKIHQWLPKFQNKLKLFSSQLSVIWLCLCLFLVSSPATSLHTFHSSQTQLLKVPPKHYCVSYFHFVHMLSLCLEYPLPSLYIANLYLKIQPYQPPTSGILLWPQLASGSNVHVDCKAFSHSIPLLAFQPGSPGRLQVSWRQVMYLIVLIVPDPCTEAGTADTLNKRPQDKWVSRLLLSTPSTGQWLLSLWGKHVTRREGGDVYA